MGGVIPAFILYGVNMNVKQVINRAFMQIGDTPQEQYTPYHLLEYYNEGNHLLNALIGQYCPSLAQATHEDNGTGRITLPGQCISVLNVKADDADVQAYHVLNLQTIVFDADHEQKITVDYIMTAGYKKLEDESGLPAELETLLVDYIVYRVMNLDISGVTANMVNALQSINDGLGNNESVIAEGYWNYGSKRIDYAG
jgi:hypothetical protein|nr:MAG TPA: hypothetical protein [Caudoviricetes sp.]DAW84243.1 MAG TPA: hypothetical protein [Caudoviricetes sp.]